MSAAATSGVLRAAKAPAGTAWSVSIPESKRALRRNLRKRLLWLGFGALHQATWISPRDLRAEVERVVDILQIRPYVELFSAKHRGFASNEDYFVLEGKDKNGERMAGRQVLVDIFLPAVDDGRLVQALRGEVRVLVVAGGGAPSPPEEPATLLLDVDRDGNTEIVVVSNVQASTLCTEYEKQPEKG